MEEVIAYIGTAILSIGIVTVWLRAKWVKVIVKAIATLNEITQSLKDGKLTETEVNAIKLKIAETIALINIKTK